MSAPTLMRPDVIVEKSVPEPGAERQSKYLFIKSFKDSVNRIVKVYNYMHVTVSKDGNEVSISNHDLDSSKVRKELNENKLLWTRFSVKSDPSVRNQGLVSQQVKISEPDENGLNPQSSLSRAKIVHLCLKNKKIKKNLLIFSA